MSFRFDCFILHETDAAIKVHACDIDEDIWLPLSAVEEIHRTKPTATLVVEEWVAKAKGLM